MDQRYIFVMMLQLEDSYIHTYTFIRVVVNSSKSLATGLEMITVYLKFYILYG